MTVTIGIMTMLSGGTMDVKNGGLRNHTEQPVYVGRREDSVEVTDSCF